MKKMLWLASLTPLFLASCNLLQPPAAPLGNVVYGLTGTGALATFGLDNAQDSVSTTAITGLTTGETLVDLDVRNTDNRLYGVTSGGKVYVISPATGAATADGASVGAATVAVDFNPVANRLRVVGDSDLNFRLTLNSAPVPATSPAGTVTPDGTFAYVGGTPNPNLVAAAYTNAFDNSGTGAVTAGTTTTLYTIDADTDTLVMNTVTPQFSTLVPVGPLGVNVSAGTTGFDITGASGAYLSSAAGGNTTLYTVNLSTGAATTKTTLNGVSLKAIALKLAPQ